MAHDRAGYPGRLVDAGNARLHMRIYPGPGGGPTVVLEGGFSAFSAWWGWVAPRLARAATTVTYDRAGLGWSEPAREMCDAEQTARRLRRALTAASVAPPYVLAGHSLGGLFVRVFAAQHPAEVAGVVLLDSAHPDESARLGLPGPLASRGERISVRLALWAAQLGLGGVLSGAVQREEPVRHLPDADRRAVGRQSITPHHLRTMLQEAAAWGVICDQARRHASLGTLPLLVVSAGQMEPGWLELQGELPALSTHSAQMVVAGAAHDTLIMVQPYAEQAADTISGFLRHL
jgi:pimeloyl-ACP methyl ester carboxylesterase